MTGRERVLAALRREEPDRVPYCEIGVDPAMAARLCGWSVAAEDASGDVDEAFNIEESPYTAEQAVALADHLHLDNLYYVMRAPVFTDKRAGKHGRLFYADGRIASVADVEAMQLPDPRHPTALAKARGFVEATGERASFLISRAGIFSTVLSLGWEPFSYALYDDRELVERLLDRYSTWTLEMARRYCHLGFDVFCSTDDMAFRTGPFFSPQLFRELVLPHLRRLAEVVTIPWVVHSDGDISPLLDDLCDLGVAGIHPVENGAMDIRAVKRRYGDRLCLLGNVDLNILGTGPPQVVTDAVRGLIRDAAPGGGYIVSSGNSLAGYLIPDNVEAMTAAVRQFGRYPIEA